MDKAKAYVSKCFQTVTDMPFYGTLRQGLATFHEKVIQPRKKTAVALGVALIAVGIGYGMLKEERVPATRAKIKMTKVQAPASHPKSAPLVSPAAVQAEGSKAPTEADPVPSNLPPDSEAFKAAQIEVTPTGYLPKISAQGLTNYEAYGRPIPPKALAAPYKLSIVVGGLGLDSGLANGALSDLPKEVGLAFYPFGPLSHDLNIQARTQGFETLVMVPLEPMTFPKDDPGPDVLLTGLDPQENKTRLYKHFSQMTGYVGTVAYQGSRFMRSESDFTPLLKEHLDRGLIFLDPLVSRRTLTHELGKKNKSPVLKTIFTLSGDLSEAQIAALLKKVEESVREDKASVLYVDLTLTTLEALKKWLPSLEAQQIALIPLSAQKLNRKYGY